MKFWTPYILLLLVITAAGYWLFLQLSLDDDSPKFARNNKAAQGFTAFYEKLRGGDAQSQRGEGVIAVDLGDQNQDQVLARLTKIEPSLALPPSSDKLDGRFRPGDTLREKLTELAKQQGIKVIWRLPKDFVVQHSFQVNETLVDTAQKMTHAIASEFENEILVFFCKDQQTLIITDTYTRFLKQNCQLAA